MPMIQEKRFTREQIMAMARYEYARQLSIYTKAQLEDTKATNPVVVPPAVNLLLC